MKTTSTDKIERSIELKAPVSKVWQALTDYQKFGQWFGVKMEGPFVAGQPARGQITHKGYEHLTMEIVVQAIEPESLFSYHWHPYAIKTDVDYSKEPPTLVTFTLKAMDGGTLLTVTESGFDALPVDRRDEAFRMNDGGWAQQIKNIETFLADSK